jgi:hypothetical protein
MYKQDYIKLKYGGGNPNGVLYFRTIKATPNKKLTYILFSY